MRPASLLLAAALTITICAGCQDGTPESPGEVTSTRPPSLTATLSGQRLDGKSFASSGGCNRVAFWAVDSAEATAVWVSLEVGDEWDFDTTYQLPLPTSFIELRRGASLGQALCGDVVVAPPYRVDSSADPVSGTLSLRVGPRPAEGCGTVGELALDNVVFDDGTVVEELTIASGDIGCFVG